MSHCDLLLKAEYLLTQDDTRRVVNDAFLAIRNGTIAGLGSAHESASWQPKEERDLGHALILPGLINAHTHTAMTFLRGFADDLPLLTWLQQKIFPVEAHLTRELVRTFSLLGFAEMLASGTTSCLDMYIFEEEVLAAARTSGIGLSLGEGIFAFPSACCQSWRDSLEVTESLAEACASSRRHSVFVSPHSVYTTNPEILKACCDLADRRNLPLHIHLAESQAEVEQCQTQRGASPVTYVHDLALLDRPCTLAHVVEATEKELDLLARAPDCVLVHNPTSNMKLASGIARIPEARARALPVALGTDGPASNNCLNMFSEMKLAALLHKVTHKNPELIPAQEALDFATLGGAKALHRQDIGSLTVGKRADLTVLDLTRPNLQPLYAPLSHVVYAASGHEVILTVVEGEILYENGRYTRFSYDDLLDEVRRLRDFLVRTYA